MLYCQHISFQWVTYFVIDPVKETVHKVVIVDAGNDQVLYTSEGQHIGSFSQLPMSELIEAEKGHGSFAGHWKAHRLFDAE